MTRLLFNFNLKPINKNFLYFALFLAFSSNCWADSQAHASPWYTTSQQGNPIIKLYFFWSKKCPHCQTALPYVLSLPKQYPWLELHSLELTEHPAHVKQYISMAKNLGLEARSVPAFFWCGNMSVGYDTDSGMGSFLVEQLKTCRNQYQNDNPAPADPSMRTSQPPSINIPLLGTLELNQYSLPVYTVILAGLDAFNPCAFFVLLFLLSLLVHAKSRKRMLVIGGIFVFFSAFLYFLFMAAWLNVFLIIGQINLITITAGGIAVLIGLLNIKDFFWFKKGFTLSIPEAAKPGLFQRMRSTINADNNAAMITAAISLAAFANLYEFLCTAGFPLVFTRILTLQELPTSTYYLYLAFYNLIYIIPLAIIVLLFTYTLGAKKLQEEQGRVLKLTSGLMMLCLGLVLLINSDWLNNIFIGIALLAIAVLGSSVIAKLERRFRRHVDSN